jgi:hypothetical protein
MKRREGNGNRNSMGPNAKAPERRVFSDLASVIY